MGLHFLGVPFWKGQVTHGRSCQKVAILSKIDHVWFGLNPCTSRYFPLFLHEIFPNVEDGTGLSLRNALRSTCPFWVQFWKGSKYCSKCWHPQRLNMFESFCSLINGKPCGQFQRAFGMDHIDHVFKKVWSAEHVIPSWLKRKSWFSGRQALSFGKHMAHDTCSIDLSL
jgi:hypothetical protein